MTDKNKYGDIERAYSYYKDDLNEKLSQYEANKIFRRVLNVSKRIQH